MPRLIPLQACEDGGRHWSDISYKTREAKIVSNHLKLREKQEADCSSESPEVTNPAYI